MYVLGHGRSVPPAPATGRALHLLGATHPKAAGDIARIYRRLYKSITARELFKAIPSLRQELWGGAF